MNKIVFFNHFNKGDIFCARPFIEQIIKDLKEINFEFYFYHQHGEYLLKDLDIIYLDLSRINNIIDIRSPNFIDGDSIYINTWIGKYFNYEYYFCGCNLRTLYHIMYSEIFCFLNEKLNLNLKLKSIIEYFPSINYEYYNIHHINNFLFNEKRKKILFCNGPALSGQCSEYNGDMSDIIIPLAKEYNNYVFIVTNRIYDHYLENIIYSGDIIKNNDLNDINEISYLSTQCETIIGRSSGPFTFSNVKENIFNKNKKFLCFGCCPNDIYPHELNEKIDCEYIFEIFSNVENLKNRIISIL